MKESILKNVYGEGCSLEVAGNMEIVKKFTNVEEEYEAIRSSVGIMDLSNYGIIKLKGDDVKELLQNITTRDFEYLPPEKVRTALLLDDDANVISLIHVFNIETYYYVLTDPQHAEVTLEWFEQHAEGDVEVESRQGKDAVIAIEGPKSWEIAKEYLPFEISAFAFMNASEIEIEDKKVIMSRFGFTGEYGYTFIAPAEIGESLWNGIMKSGEDKDIKPCGNDALLACMIEVRQPDINTELVEGSSLFESKLQWLIDFTKEDYIGYEAVKEKMEEEVPNGVIGFTCDLDKLPEDGAEVLIEDEVIGKVLCCYESKKLGGCIGLIFIKSEFVAVGLELNCKKNSGELIDIATISNPYIIPESWLVKMI